MYKYYKQRERVSKQRIKKAKDARFHHYKYLTKQYSQYFGMMENLNATTMLAEGMVTYEQSPDVVPRVRTGFERRHKDKDELRRAQDLFQSEQVANEKLLSRNEEKRFQMYADLQHPEVDMTDKGDRTTYWNNHQDEYQRLRERWSNARGMDKPKMLNRSMAHYLARGGSSAYLNKQLHGYDFDRQKVSQLKDKSATHSRESAEYMELHQGANRRYRQASDVSAGPHDDQFKQLVGLVNKPRFDRQTDLEGRQIITDDLDISPLEQKMYQRMHKKDRKEELKQLEKKLGYDEEKNKLDLPDRPVLGLDKFSRQQFGNYKAGIAEAYSFDGGDAATGLFGNGMITSEQLTHILRTHRHNRLASKSGKNDLPLNPFGMIERHDKEMKNYREQKVAATIDWKMNLKRGDELASGTFKTTNKKQEKVYARYMDLKNEEQPEETEQPDKNDDGLEL